MSTQPAEKKSKPTNVVEEAPEPEVEVDEKLQAEFERVEKLQEQLDKLDDEEESKIVELQQSYDAKRIPVYEERTKALQAIPGFWSRAVCSSFIPLFSNPKQTNHLSNTIRSLTASSQMS